MDSLLKDTAKEGLRGLVRLESAPSTGIFSPARVITKISSGMTPVSSKDTESPIVINEKKHAVEPHSGPSNVKSKRLKKLVDQLPDIGGVEDLLKLQEDLNDQQTKVRKLQDENAILINQMASKNNEIESVSKEKESLALQLRDQVTAKETILLELANKTQQNIQLENEKLRISQLLEEERNRVKQLKEELEKNSRDMIQQQKRIELLEATLRENAAQLMIEKQQYKDLTTQLAEVSKGSDEIKDKHEISLNEKKLLEQKLTSEAEVHSRQIKQLEEQILYYKKEYFYATALSIKLNMSLFEKQTKNIEIHNLYEQAESESVPFERLSKWISERVDKL